MADDDDTLHEAREWFQQAQSAEDDNRKTYEDDTVFVRAGDQWPEEIKTLREAEGRPCLTIPRLQTFARQVVNDARQNSPAIKIHPADSGADPDTADVISGLIRNIEYTSNAEVAYDTGIECAVNGGFGYWRVGVDYAYDDSFDMDLSIQRIANPLSVYGDYNSTAADSSDWMRAMVVDKLSKDQFEDTYGTTKTIQDWDDTTWATEGWREDDDVTVAEFWEREQIEKKVSQFLNRQTGELQVYADDDIEESEDLQMFVQMGLLEFKRARTAKAYKVRQHFLTGAELLKSNDWVGCYIPIVPVYGDEFNIKGKRYFRSLIHPAIDAQRMFNYWRTAATELVALAPRVPYIGPVGAFATDPNWATANIKSHPYLEYDGMQPPARQPLDSGVAAGALQEAMNASDDMKSAIGLYDASLGARSNETSGKAIMARQREGDVSTFHFQDNQSRAIRHTGRILIDLIPHFYTKDRIIRVMGEDGKPKNVPLGKPVPKMGPNQQPMMQPQMDPTGRPMMKQGQNGPEPVMVPVTVMHDLSVGKYDLTVETGPSFTTRREESNAMMTEAMRAFPPSAPILLPEIFKTFDWPNAKEIGEKMEAMSKPQVPPELQKKMQQMGEALQKTNAELQQAKQENLMLKAKQAGGMAKMQSDAMATQQSEQDSQRNAILDQQRIALEGYDAETRRIAALSNAATAMQAPPITSADAPQV